MKNWRIPSQFDILDRDDYDVPVVGSTKIFWGQYPYKAKIKGNNIVVDDNTKNVSIYQYFSYNQNKHDEEKIKMIWNSKFVNSFHRHAYFADKNHLDDFVNSFPSLVEKLEGPISEDHKEALYIIDDQKKSDKEQIAIRSRLYYKEFDSKIKFKTPAVNYRQPYTYQRMSWRDEYKHYRDMHQKVVDILGEDRTAFAYNNTYLKSEDINDLLVWLKLKAPDSVQAITKIRLVENL